MLACRRICGKMARNWSETILVPWLVKSSFKIAIMGTTPCERDRPRGGPGDENQAAPAPRRRISLKCQTAIPTARHRTKSARRGQRSSMACRPMVSRWPITAYDPNAAVLYPRPGSAADGCPSAIIRSVSAQAEDRDSFEISAGQLTQEFAPGRTLLGE